MPGEVQGATRVLTGPDISRAARSARSGRWCFVFAVQFQFRNIIARPALYQKERTMPHTHLSPVQIASGSGSLTARLPPSQTRPTAPPASAGRTPGRSPDVGVCGFRAELHCLPANGGDGSGGFVIDGITDQGYLGSPIGSWNCAHPLGDINQDGVDDFYVAASGPSGSYGTAPNPGQTYIVFGRADAVGGFPTELDLTELRRYKRLRD